MSYNTIYRNRNLTIAAVQTVKIANLKHLSQNWNELAAMLMNPPAIQKNKEDGFLFVGAEFKAHDDPTVLFSGENKDRYSRCDANVVQAQLFVLDIDNDPSGDFFLTFEEAIKYFHEFEFVAYTTFNHQKADHKHGAVDKYRIIFPMVSPALPSEWNIRREAFGQFCTAADLSMLKPSQPFYGPAISADRVDTFRNHYNDGEWFDWKWFEENKIPEKKYTDYVSSGEILESEDLNTVITLEDGSSATVLGLYHSSPRDKWFRCYAPGRRTSGGTNASFIVGDGLLTINDHGWNNRKTHFWIKKRIKVDGGCQSPDEQFEDTPTLKITDYFKKTTTPTPTPTPTTTTKNVIKAFLKEDTKGFEEIVVDEPRLSNANIKFLKKGITFVKSPKGTGKTYSIKHLITDFKKELKNDEGLLVIGHRVNLLKYLANELNLDHYKDIMGSSPHFAVSVNSLASRLEFDPFDRKIIIIDEVEQVFNYLLANTLKDEKRASFAKLVKLIQNAELIIVLDADLCFEQTIELIRKFRGKKFESDDIQAVINNYKIGKRKKIEFYSSKQQLLTEYQNTFDADSYKDILKVEDKTYYPNNIFVASNNKEFCISTENILIEKNKLDIIKSVTPSEILTVHGGNSEFERQKEFIINPENNCKGLRTVLSSPTLSTGVSIDGKHFTHVFGFFDATIGTAFDCDQAMARVRNPDVIRKIFINVNDEFSIHSDLLAKINEYCTAQQVSNTQRLEVIKLVTKIEKEKAYLECPMKQEEWFQKEIINATNKEMFTRGVIGDVKDSKILSDDDILWIWTYAKLVTNDVIRMRNRGQKLIDLYTDQGYEIIFVEEDEKAHSKGREDEKAYRIMSSLIKAEGIMNAKDIDYETSKRINEDKSRTLNESFMLNRYNIITRFIGVDLSVGLIMEVNTKEMLKTSYRLAMLLSHRDTLKVNDLEERFISNKFVVTDFKHRVQIRDLLDKGAISLKIPNIASFEDLFKSTVTENTISSESMKSFEGFVKDNLDVINKYFDGGNIGRKGGKSFNIKSVWNKVFGYVGILLDYNKNTKVYSIDNSTYALVLERELGCKVISKSGKRLSLKDKIARAKEGNQEVIVITNPLMKLMKL